MKFTKIQALGNDYICVNCSDEVIEDIGALSIKLCDRHFGIGADGVILICESKHADFELLAYNPDGDEVCPDSNAVCCGVKYFYDNINNTKKEVSVQTKTRVVKAEVYTESAVAKAVRQNAGEPVLSPSLIPVDYHGEEFVNRIVEAGGKEYQLTCVGFDGAYAVMFVPDISDVNILEAGPSLEGSSVFPAGADIVFVQVIDKENIRVRVWKKYIGEILSCGDGMCAAAVASVLCDKTKTDVAIQSVGGNAVVSWNSEDNAVWITCPCEYVFTGEINS